MKQIIALVGISCFLSIGQIQAQSIKKYNESASNFNSPVELSNNSYPASNMYRAYKKGKTSGSSLSKLQKKK